MITQINGWKEVKTRKTCNCLCCGTQITQGQQSYVLTYWLGGDYPRSERYCILCGPLRQQDKSFDEILSSTIGRLEGALPKKDLKRAEHVGFWEAIL